MKTLRATLKRSILGANARRTASQWARSLFAIVLAGLLAGGPLSPVFAQTPAQNPPSNPVPTATTAPDSSSIAPVSSLGLATHNYTHGPSAFPNILKPYEPIHVDPPMLINSPRLDQLIHDGKLEITLQDAVELALENSMDIAVQRYYPWMADAGILFANSGTPGGFGTPGATISASSAAINPFALTITTFDPIIQSSAGVVSISTPVNNPFTTGTGSTEFTSILTHSAQYQNSYSQTFETGTNFSVAWNNTRSSSTAAANLLNPYVQSTFSVSITQPLLNGFGLSMGTRNIRIAKNNRKVADWAFTAQAITTITNTITDYWELVYARENVRVNQQAVTVAEKLYEDNKKQLEIGSLAPLDVTRSESELATDTQNLIFAQTVQLQDEQILKNAISKDPLAPNIINVQIIPTDLPKQPAPIEAASFEEALKEAFSKRPELQEEALNLLNAEIDVKANRNALLPTLSIGGFYESQGLAGNSAILGQSTTVGNINAPIVDAAGAPVLINGAPIYESATTAPVTGTSQQGFTTAQSQIFHNTFPEYAGQLTLTLPLRNRAAQAEYAHAILSQRQLQTTERQLRNAAILDVRNSYIALTQYRAQVAAAVKARELQQQTFDAEQKKYQLGASTVYTVIQTQRDLTNAQGQEIRALANLEEAKAGYERAVGRTLEVNHVTVADGKSGEVERDTLIPGTLHGKVVGTDELFKSLSDGGKR
ncbi:MAG TPA: TolC family protein [Candidatus Acidoferrum sp.]|nr:TolC family protein [Candidatus Acidoferrum sp.]